MAFETNGVHDGASDSVQGAASADAELSSGGHSGTGGEHSIEDSSYALLQEIKELQVDS